MGIMFNRDMLDLVLAGKKTQTRRKVDDYNHWFQTDDVETHHSWTGMGARVYREAQRTTFYRVALVPDDGRITIKWQVGKDYALQPGRGKMTAFYKANNDGSVSYFDWESAKHVQGAKKKKDLALSQGYNMGRVKILSIRLERFIDISQADAEAEGFDSPEGFFAKIKSIYGDDFDLSQPCWVLEFKLVTA